MSGIKKVCCNPFKLHRKRVFVEQEPSELTILNAQKIGKNVTGKKVCKMCVRHIKNDAENGVTYPPKTESQDEDTESVSDMDFGEENATCAEELELSESSPVASSSVEMETSQDLMQSQDSYELRTLPEKVPRPADVELDEILGSTTPSPPEQSDTVYDNELIVEKLYELCNALSCEKVNKNSLKSRSHFEKIMKNIKVGLSKSIFKRAFKLDEQFDGCDQCSEMINQLNEKFRATNNRVEKYQVLSVVPKSWSAYEIMNTFGISKYMAENSIRIVQERGILFPVAKKIGSNTIPPDIVNLVKAFYRSSDISSDRPAMGDKIVIRDENGEKKEEQIKLVLMNLKEAYEKFKKTYPNVKIGFSKFASVRPKECILALDKKGMHDVCVCIYHQNTKLASDALVRNMHLPPDINDYKGFCAKLMCATPTIACHMRTCKDCKSDDVIRKILLDMFTGEIDQVIYKQWMKTAESMRATFFTL